MVFRTALGFLLTIAFGFSLLSSDTMPNASSLAESEVTEKVESGDKEFGFTIDLDHALTYRSDFFLSPSWVRMGAADSNWVDRVGLGSYHSRGPPRI